MRLLNVVLVGGLLWAGCGDDGNPVQPDASVDATPDAAPDAPAPVMAAAMIGPMGGMVTVPGVITIEVPPGSVDGNTMFTIAESTATPPAGATTPVYTFGPAGQVFAHPLTVRLALPAGVTSGDLYWSRPAGMTGYENIGGTVVNGVLIAEVVHFSEGYAGASATTRTVTGSQKISYVSASVFQLVPVNLTSFSIAALIENGSGGYTTIPGTGHADGTFTIDNVPDGAYWLRVPGQVFGNGAGGGTAYVRTSASAVDAGYTVRGRPDQSAVAANTAISINATNMIAWQDTDGLELYSSEANAWHFGLEGTATAGLPAPGDTTLTGLTIDMTDALAGLPHHIDGARTPPDRVAIAQLSTRTTTENQPYYAMARILEPAPFTTTAGQTTTVSGTFVDVAADNTLTLDIRGAAITASRNEETRACFQPAAYNAGWFVGIGGVAGGLAHGLAGATADFLVLDLPRPAGDVMASNMSYGMPGQGTWGAYVDARFNEPCFFTPPGATTRVRIPFSGIKMAETVAGATSVPLTVRLSQVKAPTIGGQSLFSAQTGVGTTPTIAWTAPTIGTPSFYTVRIFRLFTNADTTGARESVGQITTDQTSVTLPPGLLTTGETYVFAIDARTSGRADASAFNREALPEYTATVVSVMQTP